MPVKLLILEDEDAGYDAAKQKLEGVNKVLSLNVFEIERAMSLWDGFCKLKENKYDYVLLDCKVPVLDTPARNGAIIDSDKYNWGNIQSSSGISFRDFLDKFAKKANELNLKLNIENYAKKGNNGKIDSGGLWLVFFVKVFGCEMNPRNFIAYTAQVVDLLAPFMATDLGFRIGYKVEGAIEKILLPEVDKKGAEEINRMLNVDDRTKLLEFVIGENLDKIRELQIENGIPAYSLMPYAFSKLFQPNSEREKAKQDIVAFLRVDLCKTLGLAFKRGGIEWLTHGPGSSRCTYDERPIDKPDTGLDDAAKKIDELIKVIPQELHLYLSLNEIKSSLAEIMQEISKLASDEKKIEKLQESAHVWRLWEVIKGRLKINLHKEEKIEPFRKIKGSHITTQSLMSLLVNVFGDNNISWQDRNFEIECDSCSFFLPLELLKQCFSDEFKEDVKTKYSKFNIDYKVQEFVGHYPTIPEGYDGVGGCKGENKFYRVVLQIWYLGAEIPDLQLEKLKSIDCKLWKLLAKFGDVYIQGFNGSRILIRDLSTAELIADIKDKSSRSILVDKSAFNGTPGTAFIFVFTSAPSTPIKS